MRKLLFILPICFLIACNNNSPKHVIIKTDTTLTEAKYVTNDWWEPMTSPVFRIVKDTFTYENIESSSDQVTAKKTWRRDSLYFIPVVDTIKKDGKIELDSTGKIKTKIRSYIYIPKDLILADYNKHIK